MEASATTLKGECRDGLVADWHNRAAAADAAGVKSIKGEKALKREMQDSSLSYIRANSMMRSINAAVVLAQKLLKRES